MALLSVEQLGIQYGAGREWRSAVRDFRLTIERGQVYGLVGESGSGKTSVAGGILRYLPPNARLESESRVSLLDTDITQATQAELRRLWAAQMKLVPQNPAAALNPSQRVGPQAAESLKQSRPDLSAAQIKSAVIEMFHQAQLINPEGVYGRYPHELSGGMQQRVVIAMALLSNPALLILDEPTTGLDVTTQAAVLALIRGLVGGQAERGALYITHDLGVVAQLCQRVTVMYAGEIMADGPVSEIFAAPSHPYTLGLIAAIPRLGQTKAAAPLYSMPWAAPDQTGCAFASRCPLADARCRAEKPPLNQVGPERWSRCHYPELVPELTAQTVPMDTIEAAPSQSTRLLDVRNLTKHFSARNGFFGRAKPPIRAVDGVNLAIRAGRTLGLVGESGSGKTTLSRMIIGLEDRTSGDIHLLGAEIGGTVHQRKPETLAKIGMVFQNPQNSLNPYQTVGEALRRPLMKLRGLSRKAAETEAGELLAAVNLPANYAERLPAALSGGEKQRVAIARAFASDPALILCDEPVSALDVSVQAAVMNLLARLQDENGVSYLFISHDLAVVGYLADYLAVMYLGQLVEVGYGRDLFGPPYHPYTEALIAAIPDPDPLRPRPDVLLRGNPSNIEPKGCRFHPRCPRKIGPICENESPPWQDAGDDHFIRCHIAPDDLREAQA